MFTHAISRTNAVAASSISSGARIDPYCHSRAARTPMRPAGVRPRKFLRELAVDRGQFVAGLRDRCAGSELGQAHHRPRRAARLRLGVRTSGVNTWASRNGTANVGDRMPMMVCGWPSMTSGVPRTLPAPEHVAPVPIA